MKQMGFTKKELKSLATIKCKNLFVGNIGHKELRTTEIYEDGTIKNG